MERIEPESSWNDPPTTEQVRRIMWYGRVLRLDITETNMPNNRLEARNTIYQLRADLKGKHAHARHIRMCNK